MPSAPAAAALAPTDGTLYSPIVKATSVSAARCTSEQATDAGTTAAIDASLGCGVPTAVADLHDGETVLDLGSGAGADVLISARRVAPTGKAIGLDMTDEMLDTRARKRHGSRASRTSSSSRATSRTCPYPRPAST